MKLFFNYSNLNDLTSESDRWTTWLAVAILLSVKSCGKNSAGEWNVTTKQTWSSCSDVRNLTLQLCDQRTRHYKPFGTNWIVKTYLFQQ